MLYKLILLYLNIVVCAQMHPMVIAFRLVGAQNNCASIRKPLTIEYNSAARPEGGGLSRQCCAFTDRNVPLTYWRSTEHGREKSHHDDRKWWL
jgi:hypothetical protein